MIASREDLLVATAIISIRSHSKISPIQTTLLCLVRQYHGAIMKPVSRAVERIKKPFLRLEHTTTQVGLAGTST